MKRAPSRTAPPSSDEQQGAPRPSDLTLDPQYRGFTRIPNTNVLIKFNAKPRTDVTLRHRERRRRQPLRHRQDPGARAKTDRAATRASTSTPRARSSGSTCGRRRSPARRASITRTTSTARAAASSRTASATSRGSTTTSSSGRPSASSRIPTSGRTRSTTRAELGDLRAPAAHPLPPAAQQGVAAELRPRATGVRGRSHRSARQSQEHQQRARRRHERALGAGGHRPRAARGHPALDQRRATRTQGTADASSDGASTPRACSTPGTTTACRRRRRTATGSSATATTTSSTTTPASITTATLETIPYLGLMLGYTHHWAERWRSTVSGGYVNLDNTASQAGDAYHQTVVRVGERDLPVPQAALARLRRRCTVTSETKDGSDGDVVRFTAGRRHTIFD